MSYSNLLQVSKERKKNMIQNITVDAAEDLEEIDLESLVVPKSPQERESILSAITDHFLFQHLNAAHREQVQNRQTDSTIPNSPYTNSILSVSFPKQNCTRVFY